MKNFFGLLMLIFCGLNAQSQKTALEIYTEAQHTKTVKYQFDDRFEYLLLQSGFSKEAITRIPFSDQRIIKIDLVYTTFSEEASFDQAKLDQMRITNLLEINPQITINKFFDWNIIGQTGCESSPTCLEFFHGFVIYYEPYFTKETSKAELDSIKTDLKMLDQQIIKLKKELSLDYKRIPCEYPESLYSIENLSEKLEKVYDCSETYKGRVFFDVYMDYGGRVKEVKVNGNLFPCKEKLAKSLMYILQWKRGLTIGKQQYDLVAHGMVIFPIKKESVQIQTFEIAQELKDQYHMLQQYSQCVAYEVDTSFLPILPKVQKKVVSSVLFRNKIDPDLIIVDVTGSMYPYTADLLKWLKLLSSEKEKDFVFFNDGNDKPTEEKSIGSTGGLYHVKTADIMPARDKMFEAMRAGGGGDYPENNIEALLLGVDKCPTAQEVIMIADNYAFPRDIELISRYGGKMKIILCHTEKGINTSYLDMAKKYGFSIHTLNDDLVSLGNKVKIEGIEYQLGPKGYTRLR